MKDTIPKIIHFIWIDFKDELNKNTKLPPKYQKHISNCKKINDNYEIKVWNGYDCLELVKKYFPEKLEAYQKLKYPIMRCDWVRLMICYVYGGIYMDCDRVCQDSFDNLPDSDIILTFNIHITNDIIIAKKNSEFLKLCIDKLKETHYNIMTLDIFLSGGPMFITKMYHKYNQNN